MLNIETFFLYSVSRVDNKTCKTVIMQNFNSNNHNKSFMCDPQKSYMIVGKFRILELNLTNFKNP